MTNLHQGIRNNPFVQVFNSGSANGLNVNIYSVFNASTASDQQALQNLDRWINMRMINYRDIAPQLGSELARLENMESMQTREDALIKDQLFVAVLVAVVSVERIDRDLYLTVIDSNQRNQIVDIRPTNNFVTIRQFHSSVPQYQIHIVNQTEHGVNHYDRMFFPSNRSVLSRVYDSRYKLLLRKVQICQQRQRNELPVVGTITQDIQFRGTGWVATSTKLVRNHVDGL